MRGKGDLSFNPRERLDTLHGGRAMTLADFDGDGRLDVLAAAPGHGGRELQVPGALTFWRGAGGGRFEPRVVTPIVLVPSELADFDDDGLLDAAVIGRASARFGLFSLGPAGQLRAGQVVAAGPAVSSPVVGDFDGDGNTDLVLVSIAYLEGHVFMLRLFFGDGAGGFPRSTLIRAGAYPAHVLTADFNGDGRDDLATGAVDPGAVHVLVSGP